MEQLKIVKHMTIVVCVKNVMIHTLYQTLRLNVI